MKKLTQLIYIAYSLLYSGSLSTGAESGATNSVSITINPAVSVYRLHPGDTIEVHIYGEDDLTSKAKLNENGEVILPLLPALDLNGNTLEQANERIGSAYKKNYLHNPVVTVSIIEYGNSKFKTLVE